MTTKTQHRAPTNARPATKAATPKPRVAPAKAATPTTRRAPTPTGRQAQTRPVARPVAKAKPTAPAKTPTPARRTPTAPTARPTIPARRAPTPAAKTPMMAPGTPMMGTPPAGTTAGLNGAQADALMQTMRETGGSVGPDTHNARMTARHKIARRKVGR